MGSFSWTKANKDSVTVNVAYDTKFKFLIPKEFGGGFIEDTYQDYGYLGKKEDGTPKYDMYEILAFWNKDEKVSIQTNHLTLEEAKEANKRFSYSVKDKLQYDGELPLLKEIDKYTNDNRIIGIDIGYYDNDMDKLKYPLKLVSVSYDGAYEDLNEISHCDSEQGFYSVIRDFTCSSCNAKLTDNEIYSIDYTIDYGIKEPYMDCCCDKCDSITRFMIDK